MSFAIGQQVICIKGKWKYNDKKIIKPQFMQIYTIRAYCDAADIPAVLLLEITNPIVIFGRTFKRGEASFAEYFFRALERLDEIQELETTA